MLFVVIFLRDANFATVVPEEFILDLDQKALKNNGVNRNQDRRVYFSKEWLENQKNEINLDKKFQPNFELPIMKVYPLPDNIDEACYIARMIKFEDSFEAAMHKIRFHRRQMPAVYNDARVFEQPIPRAEYSNEENDFDDQEELETTFFDSNANSLDNDVKPVINVQDLAAIDGIFNFDVEIDTNQIDPLAIDTSREENVVDFSIAAGSFDNEPDECVDSNNPAADISSEAGSFANEFEHESTRNDADKSTENLVTNDVVYVNLNDTNVAAETQRNEKEAETTENLVRNNVRDDLIDPIISCANVRAREREVAENVQQLLLHGVKITCDDDIEYISIPGQKLEAIKDEPAYQVKVTDLLSGKKAFKQYVNGDRCFMAPKGDGFKEVRLPAKVVNGLLKMNELKRSDQFDVPFLKAVLIGFCTVKKIQEIGYINEEVFNVAKELFEWRIDGDVGRLNIFEQLLDLAIDGIKKFKA